VNDLDSLPLQPLAASVLLLVALGAVGLIVMAVRTIQRRNDMDALLASGKYRREEFSNGATCYCYWYRRAIPMQHEDGKVYVACALGTGDTPAAARWAAEKQLARPPCAEGVTRASSGVLSS